LSGCGSSSSESNSINAVNELIKVGSENLPNLYKRMQDIRPASVPGKIEIFTSSKALERQSRWHNGYVFFVLER
jgi:hypothetical protein